MTSPTAFNVSVEIVFVKIGCVFFQVHPLFVLSGHSKICTCVSERDNRTDKNLNKKKLCAKLLISAILISLHCRFFFYVILFKVSKYFSCLFVHFFHISVCRRRKNATVYQKSSFVIYLKHFICSPSECVRKLKIFGPLGFSVPK